eukprot:2512111-Prymnesium_polylepis.1
MATLQSSHPPREGGNALRARGLAHLAHFVSSDARAPSVLCVGRASLLHCAVCGPTSSGKGRQQWSMDPRARLSFDGLRAGMELARA